MRTCLLLFLGILICSFSNSQGVRKDDVDLERLMDDIFPVQDEDFDYAELYEIYAQRLFNPLNLNTATAEQLRSLSILNTAQINEFIKYRNENGPLLSLYELQIIPTFNSTTIKLIIPFLTIAQDQFKGWKNLLGRVWSEDNNYFVTRVERTVEQKVGYSEVATPANRYSGSPDKIYNRFRVSSNGDFSFGFTTEKDAGEQMHWNPKSRQFGFDYISAHAQVQNKGFLKNLIIGDYQAQFGQGLTLGGGFGMGKGSETITTTRRSNLGFIPYTSAAEYGYFRGTALSTELLKYITVHSFYSQVGRDGSTQASGEIPESISSLLSSGLHRTSNEMESRKNITEQNFGGVLQFNRHETDAGLVFHQTSFSSPIIRNPSPYNQFAFHGSTNTNFGLYWNQSINNFSLFTEVTHSLGNGTAGVLGVLASINPAFDLSLLYRRFDKNFYSFYSNAFSESSAVQNEEGIYWGWKYRFSKIHSTTGYFDIFRFPWLRFGSYKPSNGSEWMVRYNFIPNKDVQLFAQIRQERKVKNLGLDTLQYLTETGSKTNYWINADYKVSDNLGFKTRLQVVTYELGSQFIKGITIIQDINYRLKRLTISGRVALFDTDSYDTRLYAYEQDAWLTFSVPSFQGIGLREYVLIQFKASRRIDVWLRWARTEYENQETIGSGSELIMGNQRNDFKAQLRIKL